jgi:hypothetical protein
LNPYKIYIPRKDLGHPKEVFYLFGKMISRKDGKPQRGIKNLKLDPFDNVFNESRKKA